MIVELQEGESVRDCPLCGEPGVLRSEGIMLNNTNFPTPNYWVKCSDKACRCTINSSINRQQVLDSWNRRA